MVIMNSNFNLRFGTSTKSVLTVSLFKRAIQQSTNSSFSKWSKVAPLLQLLVITCKNLARSIKVHSTLQNCWLDCPGYFCCELVFTCSISGGVIWAELSSGRNCDSQHNPVPYFQSMHILCPQLVVQQSISAWN